MNTLHSIATHPVVLISIGGAVGCNARYALASWISTMPWSRDFPIATLLINVVGSIVLGVAAAWFADRHGSMYLLIGVGICGGFTTFSTFSLEIAEQIHRDRSWIGLAYAICSVLLGTLGYMISFAVCSPRTAP